MAHLRLWQPVTSDKKARTTENQSPHVPTSPVHTSSATSTAQESETPGTDESLATIPPVNCFDLYFESTEAKHAHLFMPKDEKMVEEAIDNQINALNSANTT